jgi:hypothetical protein
MVRPNLLGSFAAWSHAFMSTLPPRTTPFEDKSCQQLYPLLTYAPNDCCWLWRPLSKNTADCLPIKAVFCYTQRTIPSLLSASLHSCPFRSWLKHSHRWYARKRTINRSFPFQLTLFSRPHRIGVLPRPAVTSLYGPHNVGFCQDVSILSD